MIVPAEATTRAPALAETYPPRWRFQQIRNLVRLFAAGAVRPRERAGTERQILERLDALEAQLLPPIPSVAEFLEEQARS